MLFACDCLKSKLRLHGMNTNNRDEGLILPYWKCYITDAACKQTTQIRRRILLQAASDVDFSG